MLNIERPDPRSNELIIESLTDDSDANAMALGCATCPLKQTCGGLSVRENIVDCLDLCCGQPSGCTRVCRNKTAAYVDQVREIGDFYLRNVPRAPALPITLNQEVIPLVYHGSSRAAALQNDIFALRLPDLVNYATGELRFKTREELCAAYHISPDAEIMLTGVNQDTRIEPWWALTDKRVPIIKQLVSLGIKLVTVPNFSVVLDHPRHDDMHAMKRIGLLFSEFQTAGLPCALHPNGRTDQDFVRWRRFIAAREEVRMLAYEFTTGPARMARIGFHLDHLAKLAEGAKRDLDIIVYGKPDFIPNLRKSFRKVVYVETTSFMKSIKRQRAVRETNDALAWAPAPTQVGEVIDPLFAHNLYERALYLKAKYFGGRHDLSKAA